MTGDGDRPPLTIARLRRLDGIDFTPPVPSAQVKSAVLLAGLHAAGDTTVRETAATRDHTELALPVFGVELRRDGGSITLRGGQRPRAAALKVPGDLSSAAFWAVAAAALPGSDIVLEDVGLNPTRTAVLVWLERAGAGVDLLEVTEEGGERRGSIRIRHGGNRALTVGPADVPGLIDELPALAALATHGGELRVTGAGELRHKESDRITALAERPARVGGTRGRDDGRIPRRGRPAAPGRRSRRGRATTGWPWRSPSPPSARGGRAGSATPRRWTCPTPASSTSWRPSASPRSPSPQPTRPMRSDKIYLVGFMGAGKSSVAAALGAKLGWRVEDIDDLVERREGMAVADIFSRRGEAYFRRVERAVLAGQVPVRHAVVATGGGTYVDPANRALIDADGVSIWLDVSLSRVIERLPSDGRRPLAADRAGMVRLFRRRQAAYRRAHVRLDAGAASIGEIAERIIDRLGG